MQNPMRMTDRVVMVTGGGQGIGRQLAAQLLSLEAKVALVDIDTGKLAEARDALGASRVSTYCGDVSDPEFVNATVDSIVAEQGDLHGLINNA
ncbi:MAG TPA: 3-oxoacyl-ACP reductase, partial [Haliea salexigens]|nr:3-oxoacyl-ACP reductase [Haliea salexigens]